MQNYLNDNIHSNHCSYFIWYFFYELFPIKNVINFLNSIYNNVCVWRVATLLSRPIDFVLVLSCNIVNGGGTARVYYMPRAFTSHKGWRALKHVHCSAVPACSLLTDNQRSVSK